MEYGVPQPKHRPCTIFFRREEKKCGQYNTRQNQRLFEKSVQFY